MFQLAHWHVFLCVSSGCHAGSGGPYSRWIWKALWRELPRPLSVDVAAPGHSEEFWKMWLLLPCGQCVLLCPQRRRDQTKWPKQLVGSHTPSITWYYQFNQYIKDNSEVPHHTYCARTYFGLSFLQVLISCGTPVASVKWSGRMYCAVYL